MSLREIDEYLHHLEAIESYDQVKSDRDQAKDEITRLNGVVENLEQKLAKMEHLVITSDGKTVADVSRTILVEEGIEIDRRAKNLLDLQIKRWQKHEKPKEVANEALSRLKAIVRKLADQPHSPANYYSDDPLESALIKEVEKVMDEGVLQRIDQEFERRVDQESRKVAEEKLEILKKVEWPNFLDPRVQQLASQFQESSFVVLRQAIVDLHCDKCDQPQSFQLTDAGVADLLRVGELRIECIDSKCKDLLHRHSFPLTLVNLIRSYIARPKGKGQSVS